MGTSSLPKIRAGVVIGDSAGSARAETIGVTRQNVADGIPTDPPTSREIDFGALVRRALGDEFHKHEKVYQVGKGRTFESSDYGTQGIYGAARSVILSGTAAGGDSSSITLGTEANGGGNDYVAHQISATDFALTTQTSTIVAYNESTRSARVIPSWASNFVLHTGTAQGAGGNYLTLGTGAPSTVTGTLSLTSGAGSTQSRGIISYDDSSKQAVVSKWDAPYLSIGSDNDGAQATLYLDFPDLGGGQVDTTPTFGTVSPTFTRSGATATTVGSDGLVIKNIGANVPRSYYDPTSLTYLGYLVEGARTNILLESEALDDTTGGWVAATRASVSANATTAPDGTTTADKLVEDSTAASTHFTGQVFVKAGSAMAYTVSVFAKQGGRTWFALQATSTGASANAWFDVANGVVGITSGTYTSISSTIKAYPNGWYRCSLSYTTDTDTVDNLNIILAEGDGDITYSGDGVSSAFFWGAQKEAAAVASSYIPTTTAAVTRNADVLTYPTTGWLNAAAGTIAVEATPFAPNSAETEIFVEIDDGTTNERFFLSNPASTTTTRFHVVDGGVNQAVQDVAAGLVAGTTFKMAAAYADADFIQATDATLSAGGASGTLPTVTTLYVGLGDAGSGAASYSAIRRVAYFPLRFLNATLVTLTGSGLTFDPSTFPVALPGATTVYKVEKVGPGVNTTYSITP